MSIEVKSSQSPTFQPVEESPKQAPAAPVEAPSSEASEGSDVAVLEEEGEGEAVSELAESTEAAPESEQETKKPQKGGWQRKIERQEAQIRSLEEKLQALEARGASQKEINQVEAQIEEAGKPALQASDEPNPDTFDTHSEYVKALSRWQYHQEKKADEAKAERTRLENERKSRVQAHHDREKAFSEKTEGYAEKVTDFFRSNPKITPTIEEAIILSEDGPALLFALASDRKEFDRIASLPPIAAAKALGRLEAKVALSSEAAPKSEPVNKVTHAPKPLAPIGKSGAARVAKDPADMNQTEYEAYRREQDRRKRGF